MSKRVISLLYLPFDFLIGAIFTYILISFASLKAGIIIALTGENDGKREIMKWINAEYHPFWKLFENLGEAVPQTIMGLISIINNLNFILQEETSTWMPIPISIMSLVFSVGSIMMGLYTGYRWI